MDPRADPVVMMMLIWAPVRLSLNLREWGSGHDEEERREEYDEEKDVVCCNGPHTKDPFLCINLNVKASILIAHRPLITTTIFLSFTRMQYWSKKKKRLMHLNVFIHITRINLN